MTARVSMDMDTNSMTRTSTSSAPSSDGDAWGVLSYVLAGMLFYGGIGWLLSNHFHHIWMFVVGMIIGLVASVYLIVKRYGVVPDQNDDREGQ
ncbi:hypothetical protein FYJ43_05055 [Cutibacterium sp. WCA-380-WT-3A]|uniref:AtpZ/AtpI family protein n=1 Tax=Cutibacterium porci TaxID=2605781 RepID=A0A7K0J661_9ACTN|nr:hypothetical protein [Cutibacterium porci]MSS45417.1 hypothetical protein [Cutibacterium porci]